MRAAALSSGAFVLLGLAAAAVPAGAASKCKVKVDKKTGVITVSAASVGNNPVWGGFAGSEGSAFPDIATCFAGGKLKSCHLGSPGDPEEITPPSSCRIHIADDGPDDCAALVPGCTIGIRPELVSAQTSGVTLLNLTNTGTGQAADFRSASDFSTVYVGNGAGGGLRADVSGTSDGTAITGYNYVGDRYAAEFEGLEQTAQSTAIYARTSGTGMAIDAEVNSPTSGDALFARTTSGDAGSYAGYFSGKVHVAGTLSKTAGSFQIDHPLDPEHKYLSHSFVESPDMLNVYNGNVTLGQDGTAVVVFPAWFQALNRDFRYQLTPIGAPGVPFVAAEVANNAFAIGGPPGLRVSWQVTGIRQDPYAEANRIPVESDKPPAEVGTYLHPDVYGLPRSRSRDDLEHPIRPPAPKPFEDEAR